MKKYFQEHETLLCIVLIITYVVVNSYCMQNFGYTSVYSLIINTIFSALLIFLTIILKRVDYYGLVKVNNSKKFLYFIPLIPIASVNLWNGFNINNNISTYIAPILLIIIPIIYSAYINKILLIE